MMLFFSIFFRGHFFRGHGFLCWLIFSVMFSFSSVTISLFGHDFCFSVTIS